MTTTETPWHFSLEVVDQPDGTTKLKYKVSHDSMFFKNDATQFITSQESLDKIVLSAYRKCGTEDRIDMLVVIPKKYDIIDFLANFKVVNDKLFNITFIQFDVNESCEVGDCHGKAEACKTNLIIVKSFVSRYGGLGAEDCAGFKDCVTKRKSCDQNTFFNCGSAYNCSNKQCPLGI